MIAHKFPPLGLEEPDPRSMTLVEHLSELRTRLLVSILAVAAGSVLGWFLAPSGIALIDAPLQQYLGAEGGRLVVNTVYGGFTLQLKLAVIVGFMVALPVTLYQLWAFVAPAFGAGAQRWAPIWIGSALALFAAGATTGFLVIPLAISFFARFQGPDVKLMVFASDYILFISLILLVFGLSFELPLALVSVTATGLTSSAALARKRLYAFFGCFAFATVATPGADWISPLILGAILYVLYEGGILVSRAMGR